MDPSTVAGGSRTLTRARWEDFLCWVLAFQQTAIVFSCAGLLLDVDMPTEVSAGMAVLWVAMNFLLFTMTAMTSISVVSSKKKDMKLFYRYPHSGVYWFYVVSLFFLTPITIGLAATGFAIALTSQWYKDADAYGRFCFNLAIASRLVETILFPCLFVDAIWYAELKEEARIRLATTAYDAIPSSYGPLGDLTTIDRTDLLDPHPLVQISPSVRVELEAIVDRNKDDCTICMTTKRDTVFFPCGHFCACSHCARSVRVCPFCNHLITSTVKVFEP